MCMNVRGALMNMNDEQLADAFLHDDGGRMTAQEAKAALLDELAKGRKVIPLGTPCEGFDYTGGGCPGHVIDNETDRDTEQLLPRTESG